MSKASFLASADWRIISTDIASHLQDRIDACIQAGDFPSKEYERGWIDALRSVLALPETLLKDAPGDEPTPEIEPETETNTHAKELHGAPLHHPRRTEFFRG